MTTCPHCHRPPFDDREYKVQQQIPEKCPKNRTGSCIACQKLSEIERKITDAQRALDRLLNERDSMASMINEHHDPFILYLPVEVVSCIFMHCRPFVPQLEVFDSNFDEAEHITATFTLGHICRNWRHIVRSTPELWTIFCSLITDSNCIASVAYAQQWLQLSGGLALYVGLYIQDEPNVQKVDLLYESTHQIMASMSQHSQRLKVLNIRTLADFLPLVPSALINGRLDYLEHLILDVLDVDDDIADDRVLSLDASPLTVTLRGGWLERLSINWSHLTRFVAEHEMTIHECHHLFRDAPLLSFCNLPIISAYGAETVSPTQCPSLQTIILRSFPKAFCRLFAFPSLTSLRFMQAIFSDHIQELLRYSGCNITKLTIENGYLGPEQVLKILKATPDLERLSLEGEFARESLFLALNDELSQSTQSRGLLTRLKSLHFATVDPDFGWGWFPPFLGHMKGKSLQSFEIRYKNVEMKVDPTMLQMVLSAAEGLNFRMIDDNGRDLVDRLCTTHHIL